MLPLSIQLYSLRTVQPLAAQLDLVKAAGYQHVELFGPQLDDAANIKPLLEARGLKASSAHVGLAPLRDHPHSLAKACQSLGIKQLFMPAVPPDDRERDGPFWHALGRELGELARGFAHEGIALGYHNHHWELKVKEGGKTALELFFDGAAETEGSHPLMWQADVAWLVRGGAKPEDWLRRYKTRIASVHAKDLSPEGTALDEDGWADVGHGVLDWQMLSKVAVECGAKWFVAEHDKPNDAARFTDRSFAYLNSLKA